MFVSLCLMSVATSCSSDDDPVVDPVTPPSTDEIIETVKTGSLTGVVAQLNGTAINGATVTAINGSKTLTASTSSDGKYTFADIDVAGTYSLTAAAEGYVSGTGSADVVFGETALLDFQLNKEAVTKSETVSETETTTITATTDDVETATSTGSSDEGSLQTESGDVATVEVEAVVPAKSEVVEVVTSDMTEEQKTAVVETITASADAQQAEAEAKVAEAQKAVEAAQASGKSDAEVKALQEEAAKKEEAAKQYAQEAEACKSDPVAYYEDLAFTVTPVSDEATAASTRAASREFLFGSALGCNKLIKPTIKNPVDIGFTLDSSLMSYVNGYTVAEDGTTAAMASDKVSKDNSNGKITLKADQFTSYAVYIDVNVTSSTGSEAVTFAQSSYDNRYNTTSMSVNNPTYTYKTGAEVTQRGSNKLAAYLLEILAKKLGNVKSSTATGTYSLSTTLSAGQGLDVSGSQAYTEITVSCGSTKVVGRKYGKVSCSISTYSRDHNGGSAGN